MRVLVCGGRDYDDVEYVYSTLDRLAPSAVISGAQTGADSIALMWADERGIEPVPFPADWHKHGKAAGPIRNQQMIDKGKPDVVIAFPGGKGTNDMIQKAEQANIPVLRF